MINPSKNQDSKNRRQESTTLLVCSSHFSSCFGVVYFVIKPEVLIKYACVLLV